jgi:hypothetical protein
MFFRISLLFFSACALCSCTAKHLSVSKIYTDKKSLASTFTRAPDPLQSRPPEGDRLYIAYLVPSNLHYKDVQIKLSVIWKNLHQQEVVYFPKHKAGMFSYSLINKDYKASGGIFTYKVDMVDQEGKVVDTFTQRMWVKLLNT